MPFYALKVIKNLIPQKIRNNSDLLSWLRQLRKSNLTDSNGKYDYLWFSDDADMLTPVIKA
jgi:hypothetical protein